MRAPALSLTFAVTAFAGIAACTPRPAPVAPPTVPAPAPMAVAPPVVRMPPALPPVALCDRGVVRPTFDGRLFNHFSYGDAAPATLVSAPPELSPDGSCKVHPAILSDLTRLVAAANGDPAITGQLRGISCHRSIPLQAQTFCGGIGPDGSASFAERAQASAPPGFSEHATGYVIDFGTTASRACDAEACFAATAAGRWLRVNAPRFGFEMSFPVGNRQQVKWEPWHWRWVGSTAASPGAAAARALFTNARARFPAKPRPAG